MAILIFKYIDKTTQRVGSEKILNWMQEHFAREFRRFGTLKETDGLLRSYEVKQAWTRIRRHIKIYPN